MLRNTVMLALMMSASTAMANPVDVILFGGQSNAGMGGQAGVILSDPLYPDNVIGFNGGLTKYGATPVSPDTPTSIGPAFDRPGAPGKVGQYPATLTGFALAAMDKAEGRAASTYFIRTDWYGGKALDTFVEGTTSWNNLAFSASRSTQVLRDLGREARVAAYFWIQGEAGPSGEDRYLAGLRQYADSVVPMISSKAGQTAPPEFVFVQTNMPDTDVKASGVELAQLAFARERYGKGVTLAGPSYQLPLSDGIHNSPIGRMMQGEQLALVYQQVIQDGKPFRPLMPVAITMSGREVDVRFLLPGEPLKFDTQWVEPAPNYGFQYVDSDASAAIERVDIVSPYIVRITLDREPTGSNRRITYAQAVDTERDGWSAGRGQLISPSGKESTYHKLGYPVPASIDHYAVRFDDPIRFGWIDRAIGLWHGRACVAWPVLPGCL